MLKADSIDMRKEHYMPFLFMNTCESENIKLSPTQKIIIQKNYFSSQGWFNTRKSMTVIHISRVSKRKESSEHLRRDTEHIHEISNHSWLKSKLRTKGNLLNLIMDIYSKTATDIVLTSKMLEVFTLKWGCHLEYIYF